MNSSAVRKTADLDFIEKLNLPPSPGDSGAAIGAVTAAAAMVTITGDVTAAAMAAAVDDDNEHDDHENDEAPPLAPEFIETGVHRVKAAVWLFNLATRTFLIGQTNPSHDCCFSSSNCAICCGFASV